MTPLGASSRGLVASAFGTLTMDLWLFSRYRRGGGDSSFGAWEFSSDVHGWEEAPAPAQVGERFAEGVLRHPLPPERAVNNTAERVTILAGAGCQGAHDEGQRTYPLGHTEHPVRPRRRGARRRQHEHPRAGPGVSG
jgi:hypothetical protein